MTRTTDLAELRRRAAGCTACELHADATQTVFGRGPLGAWLMLVGEQPGDREDLAGQPFVGPAGRLLDTALDRAGIDRDAAYLTNAVKHFRFTRSGKRRLHRSPTVAQMRACRPWLDDELHLVDPAVVVTLGATAAKALLGTGFRLTAERGRARSFGERQLVPTVHPSAILRTPSDDRDAALDALVADLAVAAGLRPA